MTEAYISILLDEPPSQIRLWGLSVARRFASLSHKAVRRLPVVLPVLFFLFIFALQGRDLAAAYQARRAPLSFAQSESVSFAVGNFMNPTTLELTDNQMEFGPVAFQGENIGGLTDAAANSPARQHVVIGGQTIGSIADIYDLHIGSIMLANRDLDDAEKLQIGQVLTIPSTDASSAELDAEWAQRQKQMAKSNSTTISSQSSVKKQSKTLASVTTSENTGFKVPVRYKYISQGFTKGHQGIDFVASSGSPVYATKGGCIITRSSGWNGGYGNVVLQDIGGGYTARYAHLSSFVSAVRLGDCVARGELIGYSGSTGRSTGPHLHFEIRKNGVAIVAKF